MDWSKTMTLEKIKSALASDYGIQALNTHDVDWLVRELERLTKELGYSEMAANAEANAHDKANARIAELTQDVATLQEANSEICGDLLVAEQERDQWQEIANRWIAVSNDQALVVDALKQERDGLAAKIEEISFDAESAQTAVTLASADIYQMMVLIGAENSWQDSCPVAALKQALARIKAEAVRDMMKAADPSHQADSHSG
jgi:chromosome segregation ATPase